MKPQKGCHSKLSNNKNMFTELKVAWQDLAASIDEGDVAKFTDAVKEFDSMTRLDPWKTTPSEGKERAKEKGGRRRG